MSEETASTTREQNRAVWNAMAAGWESQRDALWADTNNVSHWLVEHLAPRPGDTVLELAGGVGDTGLLAARRVGAHGKVLITDFAPEMVAAARRRAVERGIANVEFRVLDAERMDLATDSVDGVICRWAYMLMADPAAALAETRRVLRPGGRLAFSVWGERERNPWALLANGVLVARRLLAAPDPAAPGIFALADQDRLRELVVGAGFAEPLIEEVPTHRRYADFDDYWRYLNEMAGAIAPILRGLSPAEQGEVKAELRAALAPFADGRGYDTPGLCFNVVTS
jgi:ubiquinone/menaquinone biosynthesis C-methylase UbiE